MVYRICFVLQRNQDKVGISIFGQIFEPIKISELEIASPLISTRANVNSGIKTQETLKWTNYSSSAMDNYIDL